MFACIHSPYPPVTLMFIWILPYNCHVDYNVLSCYVLCALNMNSWCIVSWHPEPTAHTNRLFFLPPTLTKLDVLQIKPLLGWRSGMLETDSLTHVCFWSLCLLPSPTACSTWQGPRASTWVHMVCIQVPLSLETHLSKLHILCHYFKHDELLIVCIVPFTEKNIHKCT